MSYLGKITPNINPRKQLIFLIYEEPLPINNNNNKSKLIRKNGQRKWQGTTNGV